MAFNEKSYYIARVENLESIFAEGILSYNGVSGRNIPHSSFALDTVQQKRDGKSVPNGHPLHDYANFYLDARNPAMFLLNKKAQDFNRLCVVVINAIEVLKLPG